MVGGYQVGVVVPASKRVPRPDYKCLQMNKIMLLCAHFKVIRLKTSPSSSPWRPNTMISPIFARIMFFFKIPLTYDEKLWVLRDRVERLGKGRRAWETTRENGKKLFWEQKYSPSTSAQKDKTEPETINLLNLIRELIFSEFGIALVAAAIDFLELNSSYIVTLVAVVHPNLSQRSSSSNSLSSFSPIFQTRSLVWIFI